MIDDGDGFLGVTAAALGYCCRFSEPFRENAIEQGASSALAGRGRQRRAVAGVGVVSLERPAPSPHVTLPIRPDRRFTQRAASLSPINTHTMASMMGMRASGLARPAVQHRRTSVVVMAAADEKKKRLPQPVKRAQQAVERRMENKSRKSATATRVKKVRGTLKEERAFCGDGPPFLHRRRARCAPMPVPASSRSMRHWPYWAPGCVDVRGNDGQDQAWEACSSRFEAWQGGREGERGREGGALWVSLSLPFPPPPALCLRAPPSPADPLRPN